LSAQLKYRRAELTDKHLDDLLPGSEPLNEDVGRLELMGSSVLLDLRD
jgi:hypothetical protein